MDATAILGLMSDLYAQVSRLTAENAALNQEIARISNHRPTSGADPAP